jgi:hypothetical protein
MPIKMQMDADNNNNNPAGVGYLSGHDVVQKEAPPFHLLFY